MNTRKRPLHDTVDSIYMDFHGSSSSGKKVLKVPITQAAKLFEGERENDLMKKMWQ